MPMDKWDACGDAYTDTSLEGRPCFGGLDLSSTSDLTAFVLVFPPEGEDKCYHALPFFWLPEETMALRVRRDHVMYDVWAKEGYIHALRGNAAARGYDTHWREARKLYLQRHPLCVKCLEDKKITPATIVDHIVPHRGDKTLFWDQENWQALCKNCHDKKTGRGL